MSVYFISARELDMVKIGWANNPIWRLRTLQTACPMKLTLEGAIPGGARKEAELHKRFARARLRGEWFKLTPELRREIKQSSRPEKFSPVAVKHWLKKLDNLTEALEPASEFREQRIRELEERAQEEMGTRARRSRMTELERLEADGVIHFPFRAKETA